MAVILFGMGVGVLASVLALCLATPSILSVLAVYGGAGVAGSAALILVLLRGGEADGDADPPSSRHVGAAGPARAPPNAPSPALRSAAQTCASGATCPASCAALRQKRRLVTSS